jgi:uncharacterized membrane protein
MQDLRVGDIVSRAFSILFKNFVPFMVLTAIVYTPIIVMTLMMVSRAEAGEIDEQGVLIFGGSVGFATFLLNLIASAAVMYGVIQQLRGQHASMGACISVGLKRLLPVLGTGLLMGICILLGFVALIVPGIILTLMFYVAVPATVIEHQGPVEALKRSKALTDGYKGALFGLNFLIGLIGAGVGLVIGLLQEALPGTAGLIINLGSDVFFGALSAVVTAIVYHDLRAIKEGVNVDDLVRVFE